MDLSSIYDKLYAIAQRNQSSFNEKIMKNISVYSQQQETFTSGNQSLAEHDPEYLLIVDASHLLVEIDIEVDIIHYFVRGIYHKRFPELEQFVRSRMDYLATVQELGNNIDQANMNENLLKFLTHTTVTIVGTSASTSEGTNLTKQELDRIMEACELATKLNKYKHTILSYVEPRMKFIAPNLSIIVGASTAAKLIGMARGLTNLTKKSSCEILLLGADKNILEEISSTTPIPRAGSILYSKVVQNCSSDLHVQAAAVVAVKVILAAHADRFHQSPQGETGKRLLSEIEQRLEELQEPFSPPNDPRTIELRTQADQMKFEEIEEDAGQGAISLSTHLVEKPDSEEVRAAQADSDTEARIPPKLQKTLPSQNPPCCKTTTVRNRKQISGTTSSVAFTPLQGVQFIAPNAAEKDETGVDDQK